LRAKVKVAIMTCLFAKRNMNIDTSHATNFRKFN